MSHIGKQPVVLYVCLWAKQFGMIIQTTLLQTSATFWGPFDHRMKMKLTKIILASRPGPDSPPDYSNFEVKHEEAEFSSSENQILVKTMFLSVDPALR